MKKIRIHHEGMWYEIHDEFGESGGVYILKCINEMTGSPIVISRFLACDEQGVLYIGKANCFVDRVAELKKSISPKYSSSSHECGARYKSNEKIREKFPYESLCVELIGSEDPRRAEVDELRKYEMMYGELPPLNRCS